MALERHRRIAQVWNWLPAFRAVAEYESVQAAAAALASSPSALSRMVKLLEESLGELLFQRTPAGLVLTARGRALLLATRDSMRRLDDALSPNLESTETTMGATSPMLLSVLARAVAPAGGRPLALELVAVEDVPGALLRGALDLALVHEPTRLPALVADALPELRFTRAGTGSRRAAFVSLERAPLDGTPAVATATTLEAACTLAAALEADVVLPECLVPGHLRPLESIGPPVPVFAVRRAPLAGDEPTAALELIDRLRALLRG
jgi:DNA-binding transcriptional LysR family regulator